MKEIRDIFNSVYQDANAMTMFDATIANFTVSNAMLSTKKIVEGNELIVGKKEWERMTEVERNYIRGNNAMNRRIAKLFESEGK